MLNPCMVFGSVGPVFSFYLKKKETINYFFNLKFIGFGSFSVKNINLNTFSMTAYCRPPLRIYITYKVFGSTGPGANKSVESVPVYLHSVYFLSGATDNVLCISCSPTKLQHY